jgi:predicted DsbA family dithiol-disulfide isomerase
MRSIILISHWFYPANTLLLVWLTACALAAVAMVIAGWTFRGAVRRCFAGLAAALCGIGGIVSFAMMVAEAAIFEFGSPLCVAAYAALLATFVWLFRQSRSERPLKLECAGSFVLASAAFSYLFMFGIIPYIVELPPDELRNLEGANVIGRSSAILLVTEFGDFECPACAMQDEAMDRLWRQYPDRIRYSFRHLPKQRHPHAAAAALASQCAAEQGRFWETKRLLFANQNRLGEILANTDLPTIPAGEAESYARCVQSKSAWSHVGNDLERARILGLTATPSVVVGNKLVQGMISYPRLALIVRRELESRGQAGTQTTSAKPEPGCSVLVERACTN